MIHWHGLLKFILDLGGKTIADQCCRGREAEIKIEKHNDVSFDFHLEQDEIQRLEKIVEEGKRSQEKLIRLLDILVTHDHPDPSPNVFVTPDPHPCTKCFCNIPENQKHDHKVDMMNCCGIHARCTAYCLRTKFGRQYCRMLFGDPQHKPITTQTRIEFEPNGFHSDGTDRVKIKPIFKRNHLLVNNINESQFYLWGFNTDCSPITDEYRAMMYATKYSTKQTKRTETWKQLISTVSRYSSPNVSGKSVILKTIMQSHKEIDRGVQECCHFINSQPAVCRLYMSPQGSIKSLTEVKVNLKGSKMIKDNKNFKKKEIVTQDSILDAYSKRTQWNSDCPNIDQMSLIEFVKKFRYFPERDVIESRVNDVFVTCFPTGKDNVKHKEGFNDYCKYQLMKFKPWKEDHSELWDNEESSCVQKYHEFLSSNLGQQKVVNHSSEKVLLENAMNEYEDEDDEDDDVDKTWGEENPEAWQLLARQELPPEPVQQNLSELFPGFNWNQSIDSYDPGQFERVDKWIDRVMHEDEDQSQKSEKNSQDNIDIQTLSKEQAFVVSFVEEKLKKKEQFVLLMAGTAGTGKTYTMMATKQRNDGIKVLAPTACAAFLLGGQTACSALYLPVKNMRRKPMSTTMKATYQKKFEGIETIIIDEMSMISHEMMGWIDYRLGEIGDPRKRFGGFNLIYSGDFAQLPPCSAPPLFSKNTDPRGKRLDGKLLYENIEDVVYLQVLQRQNENDKEFKDCIFNIRDGNITESPDDPTWKVLCSRAPEKIKNIGEFEDAVHVWYRRAPVQEWNREKLLKLNSPVANIKAIHPNKTSERADSRDACNLESTLQVARGARVMYVRNK